MRVEIAAGDALGGFGNAAVGVEPELFPLELEPLALQVEPRAALRDGLPVEVLSLFGVAFFYVDARLLS